MTLQWTAEIVHPEWRAAPGHFIGARRSGFQLWGCAALAAVALHAACILLILVNLQSENLEDDPGAPAIEVGLQLAAPQLPPTNLPPGPEADDAAASPAVGEQKANPEESELPKATPTETEDPDRLVAPVAQQKPKEDDPDIKTVELAASTESAASESAAPPTPEIAVVSERSVAPAQGTGVSVCLDRMTWEKQLAAHLNRHKRYPAGATRRNVEIVVSFTLDRMGHVLAAGIVKSSGDSSFDEAALSMVRRSDPVPQPPPLAADEGLTFTLPVIFRVKTQK